MMLVIGTSPFGVLPTNGSSITSHFHMLSCVANVGLQLRDSPRSPMDAARMRPTACVYLNADAPEKVRR